MRASVIFAPHFVHGASIRRSRNKVGARGEAGINTLQIRRGTQQFCAHNQKSSREGEVEEDRTNHIFERYMLVETAELIWVNTSRPADNHQEAVRCRRGSFATEKDCDEERRSAEVSNCLLY